VSFGSISGGRTLFLDLDGVMADFDGGFPAKFGFDHRNVPDEVMWDAIEKDGKFFRELPPCEGALDFYRLISMWRPVILTACPAGDKFVDVAQQKRAWVERHLQSWRSTPPIVFTPGGKTKALYMNRPGDILIDDFERNIERWREAGGVGIHHTGDFQSTWDQLSGAIWPKSLSASVTNRVRSAAQATTSEGTTTDTAGALAVDFTSHVKEKRPLTPLGEEYLGPVC